MGAGSILAKIPNTMPIKEIEQGKHPILLTPGTTGKNSILLPYLKVPIHKKLLIKNLVVSA